MQPPGKVDLADAKAQAERLGGESAESLIAWAYDTFAPHVALSCSFGGPGGLVLAHMAYRLKRPIPVVFVDTQFLFPETYALKERLEREWGLAVRTVATRLTPLQQASRYGVALWQRDPDLCCQIRKVEPMAEVLHGLSCWVTSLRRDQGESRKGVEVVEIHRLPGGAEMLKLNPLAHWRKQEVWAYVERHHVPYNPLLDAGYKSIGCIQCTAKAGTSGERSGRWQGSQKTECGLHTFTLRET